MNLVEYLDSERVQEDKRFLASTLAGAIAEAWYEGYRAGMQEGERIWRSVPKAADER